VDPRVFTLARRGDRRFSDDQIFAILRAAEVAEGDAADLCRAAGITVPTYCVWKARYGRLTLPELSEARRRERRAGILRGLLFTSMCLAAGGASLWRIPGGADPSGPGDIARAVQPVATVAAEAGPVSPPAEAPGHATIQPDPDPTAAAGERRAGTPRPPGDREVESGPRAATTAADASPPAAPLAPFEGEAYAVQVAATPDAQQARRAVERLAAAGHPAYVLPAIVGNTEVFRVRVGPFASRPEAQEAVVRLEREGHRGPWIAR
jgi:cell division septation protein DedD